MAWNCTNDSEAALDLIITLVIRLQVKADDSGSSIITKAMCPMITFAWIGMRLSLPTPTDNIGLAFSPNITALYSTPTPSRSDAVRRIACTRCSHSSWG